MSSTFTNKCCYFFLIIFKFIDKSFVAIPSSIGLRSSLCTFSTIANSNDFRSSACIYYRYFMKACILSLCHLLSPAIISYLSDFSTIIGCIIPRSLIEFVRSSIFALSKFFLAEIYFSSANLLKLYLI